MNTATMSVEKKDRSNAPETPLYLEVPGYSKDGPDRPNMERVFELAGRPFPLPPVEPSA